MGNRQAIEQELARVGRKDLPVGVGLGAIDAAYKIAAERDDVAIVYDMHGNPVAVVRR